jgi:hypothetical protein
VSRIIDGLVLGTVGLAALIAAGPTIVRLIQVLVPLVLVVGVSGRRLAAGPLLHALMTALASTRQTVQSIAISFRLEMEECTSMFGFYSPRMRGSRRTRYDVTTGKEAIMLAGSAGHTARRDSARCLRRERDDRNRGRARGSLLPGHRARAGVHRHRLRSAYPLGTRVVKVRPTVGLLRREVWEVARAALDELGQQDLRPDQQRRQPQQTLLASGASLPPSCPPALADLA